MSAWSGIVVGAIALAVVVVAVGQPAWEWRLSDSSQVDIWSYGLFGATHTIENKTFGNATVQNFTYLNLPNQSRMAALFSAMQLGFEGAVACIVAALALSAATLRRRLRGMFAGSAMVAGCLLALVVPLYLVLQITSAAEDLPQLNGNSLPSFEGQILYGPSLLTWGPNVTWYLLLGLCILLAFGASEVWSLRPSRKPAARQAVLARGADPPPPEPPTPAHLEPAIEEVFVIGSNGLLIKHMSRTLMSEKDRDVVGGMISVLSNFVRETFSERDGNDVQEVTLGDHRFILCNERGIVVAVLVTRGATEDIVPRLRHLLACLIDRYADKLDEWGGEPLEGIEDEIAVLWQPFFLPPPPAD
ncbi:MAG TPA: roadblock/LC7 domain-containing protein [Thermoplasmata archaeon]|nr:roadblock/LC7 domain-containing protein [Thermoplasmata archaeon]